MAPSVSAAGLREPKLTGLVSSLSPRPELLRHAAAVPEESLVADTRAGLTPAQMVERKLVSLLKSKSLVVSHMMSVPGKSR